MVGFPRGGKGGPKKNKMLLIVILLNDNIQYFKVVGYAYANMLKDRRAYDKTVETSVYVRFAPPVTIEL